MIGPQTGGLARRVQVDLAVDALVGALPPLATLALYLPSGVLMPFRLAALAIILIAVARFAAVRRVAAPRVTIATAALAASFVLFGAVGALRFPGRVSGADALRTLVLLALALATAVLSERTRTVLVLLASWGVTCVGAAAVGVWEVVTSRHLPKDSPANELAESMPWRNEVASFFDNPNLYAYMLGIVILLLPVMFHALPRWWRWAVVPLGLLLLFLLNATSGRLVIAAVGLGLGVWALRSRIGRLAALIVGVAFGVGILARVPPVLDFVQEAAFALSEFSQPGASSWVRMELARSGMWMLEQSGFLGVGPGGYGTWSLLPDDPFRYESLNNAHSGLVEVTAEYGVVTVGVLVVLLVAAAVAGVRWSRDPHQLGPLERSIAYGAAVQVIAWPLLSASHSTWMRQPLAAAHVATIVACLACVEACRARMAHPGARPGHVE